MIIIKNKLKNFSKKNGFTIFETILSLLTLSIILNLSYIKYQKILEYKYINEAKIKINDGFFQTSIDSLKTHTSKKLKFDFIKKKIIIYSNSLKKEKEIYLPKNLIYYHTLSNNHFLLNITFTPNGNIQKSFSIYIFNKKNLVKYKIAFYGFNECKFLKINNYRKKENTKISLSYIAIYHEKTNIDREKFYEEWKKE